MFTSGSSAEPVTVIITKLQKIKEAMFQCAYPFTEKKKKKKTDFRICIAVDG